MSLIKFGNRKYKSGLSGPLKFGIFKWGQPNKFYLLYNLLEYLPTYIIRNDMCMAVLRTMAKTLLWWHRRVVNLKKYRLSGMPGLKYANENWKLFLRDDSSSNDIFLGVKNLYNIHTQRGTEGRMLEDIKNITYGSNSWYKYYGQDIAGWWLDISFPEISTDGYSNKYNKLTYLELENMLFVEYYNLTGRDSAFIEKIMLREAIPVNINTTFLEVKPYPLKFGTFKFGQPVKGRCVKFNEIRAARQLLIGS